MVLNEGANVFLILLRSARKPVTTTTREREKRMFECEIRKHVVDLSETDTTVKQLNLVSWNGRPPKYDIRNWKKTEDGLKAAKGVTLDDQELNVLAEALNDLGYGKE